MEIMNGCDPYIFEPNKHLRDSKTIFLMNNDPTVRSGSIRNLFIKHGFVDGLGLILFNKHIQLGDGHALVDYDSTAMVWDLKDTTVIDEGVLQKHGGFIKPCAWFLSPTKERLISYEFYFHHNNATNNVTYSQTTLLYLTEDFVDEFAEILHQDSLAGVLGVCLLK